MALIPPERSSKRINKGQLSDKTASTTRRVEGAAVVRNLHVNLDVPGSTSLYTFLREWSHDNPSLFPDLYRQSATSPQPSYPVQFIPHKNVRTPPSNAPSTDEAFAEAIQKQDESISIATHIPHWQAVRRYWVGYFEAQESLMVTPDLISAIVKDINRPWSNKQEHFN